MARYVFTLSDNQSTEGWAFLPREKPARKISRAEDPRSLIKDWPGFRAREILEAAGRLIKRLGRFKVKIRTEIKK